MEGRGDEWWGARDWKSEVEWGKRRKLAKARIWKVGRAGVRVGCDKDV